MRRTTYADLGLYRGGKPVRPLRKRTVTPSWDGMFASSKALNGSDFESLLERDCQIVLSGDPRIKKYACQPHVLTYYVKTRAGEVEKHTYTPDFVADTADNRILVIDAKAAFFKSTRKWERLEPHIRQAYQQDFGVEFHVWTEADIRAEPRFSNAKTLHRHRFAPADRRIDFSVRRILLNVSDNPTVGSVCRAADQLFSISESEAFGAVMRLALIGEIELDPTRRIDLDTVIIMGACQ